jgi:hypothetical protein
MKQWMSLAQLARRSEKRKALMAALSQAVNIGSPGADQPLPPRQPTQVHEFTFVYSTLPVCPAAQRLV